MDPNRDLDTLPGDVENTRESSRLLTTGERRREGYSSTATSSDDSLLSQQSMESKNNIHPVHQGLKNSWEQYYYHMNKRPLLVKSITACFIIGGADLCAQGIEHMRGLSSEIDWPRYARFSVMGLLGAPWSHYYFQYLDQCLPPTPEPFTKTTLLKVFIDQFIQAPLLLLVMICSLSLMKFEGLQVVEKDVVESFWPGLIANWKLWITASLVNLAFVKPELRVLYTNVIFFVWIIILSIILNTPQ